MSFRKSVFFALGFIFLVGTVAAQLTDPFEWDIDLGAKEAPVSESIPVTISFRIPPNHILYRDKMGIEVFDEAGKDVRNISLSPLEFSPSIRKEDPFFHKEVDVYEGGALLQTSLRFGRDVTVGKHKLLLRLSYQGCSESLCFRLMKKDRPLTLRVLPAVSRGAISAEEDVGSPYRTKSILILILLSFLGGVASDFTPCVLPIIPITLAFIGIRKNQVVSIRRNFLSSLILVLSMSLSYAILGLAAALLGKSLGFLFQSVYFLLFAIALYVAFALSLLGLFDFQIPMRIRNSLAKVGGEGSWGTVLAGLTIGFLAAPCVGPLIASLLLYVAQEKDTVKGFVLLFSYGLGMGSLFLLMGTFYHRLASRFHAGPYTVWIKRAFAVVLLIPAVYYGFIAVQHFRAPKTPTLQQQSFWETNEEKAMSRAIETNKPLFVDFFAAWCLPCVEMESKTFPDPMLQKFLKENFISLKIDCTTETPQCQKMVERYSIVGWPTFLILSPKGEVIEMITGKNLSPSEIQALLKNILNR